MSCYKSPKKFNRHFVVRVYYAIARLDDGSAHFGNAKIRVAFKNPVNGLAHDFDFTLHRAYP